MRLAIAIAQGIALALDRPLLPVSTLQTLAMRAPAEATHVLACIDARMGEVYAARCVRDADGVMQVQGSEVVIAPDALQLPDDGSDLAGVGTGFAAADGLLVTVLQPRLFSLDARALPHAADVLKIAVPAFIRGEGIAPELVQPAYLRDNVALTLVERRALRASR